MADSPREHPVLEEELAALADGSLDPARTEAVLAAVASSPDLAAKLAAQERARGAVLAANAHVEAPMSLRERIAQTSTAATARPRRRRGWLGALAGVAVVALLIVTLVPLGGVGGPTVARAAAAAARPPDAPAPGPGGDKLLALAVDGVSFPDYAGKFGWTAVGTRTDEVNGRTVTTVTYEKDGKRVAYAIVAGAALEVPEGQVITAEQTAVTALTADGRQVVTWQRQGHTCVMVASDVDAATLAELAGWKGKGAVTF